MLLQPYYDYEWGEKRGRRKILSLRLNTAWGPSDIIKVAKAMPAAAYLQISVRKISLLFIYFKVFIIYLLERGRERKGAERGR